MVRQFAQSSIMFMSKRVKELSQKYDVVDFTVGEPNYHVPENVKEAACRAVMNNTNKYTSVVGVQPLLDAICKKYNRGGHQFNQSNVIVSTGAKQVIFNAFFASTDKGDEIIIPAPYWSSYPPTISLCGSTPVIVNCGEEHGFKLQAAQLRAAINKNTKWLIINSPNNPTGAVYSYSELKSIADVLREHDHVNILVDSIYEDMVFGGNKSYSFVDIAPDLKDRILIVNGMSKSYAMAGWRLGYGIGNEKLISNMAVIQSNITTNASSIVQYAAVEALTGPQGYVEEHRCFLERNKDVLVLTLREFDGISLCEPQGAFYLFVNCKDLIDNNIHSSIRNDVDLSSVLLEEAHVGVVPGSGFGAPGYIRISYATSFENVQKGATRIVEFFKKIYSK